MSLYMESVFCFFICRCVFVGLLLVRKQFSPFVERMHVDVDNVVVLRMKKVLLGTDKDVMFITAYLPQYDSNYRKVTQHGYGVELIEKCYGPA